MPAAKAAVEEAAVGTVGGMEGSEGGDMGPDLPTAQEGKVGRGESENRGYMSPRDQQDGSDVTTSVPTASTTPINPTTTSALMRGTLQAVFGSRVVDGLQPLAFEVPELDVRVLG